jgi:two-component system chemotaxis response regulator CheB
MIVVDGRLELSHGPRENWARPAIDPLFRSAAEAYGAGAIGILMTGQLNDGTAGLFEIKRRGGITIVQDPSEAEASSMPRSAIENVSVDFCLPLSEMGRELTGLVMERSSVRKPVKAGERAMSNDHQEIRNPSAQTCPECGSAMAKEMLGTIARYRCHIGHAMTAEVLVVAQLYALEKEIESVLRTLNERRRLCEEMADKHAATGNEAQHRLWQRAAEETRSREALMRKLAEADWVRPETGTPAE